MALRLARHATFHQVNFIPNESHFTIEFLSRLSLANKTSQTDENRVQHRQSVYVEAKQPKYSLKLIETNVDRNHSIIKNWLNYPIGVSLRETIPYFFFLQR